MKMLKKMFAALLVVLGVSPLFAVTQPAQADITWGRASTSHVQTVKKGWPGGSVDYWHYYGGIVRYIIIDCNGRMDSLFPGQWSKSIPNCPDVDGFFVQSGSKLFCGERYGLRDYVYYPGWHSIGNFSYRACEMRAHNG